MLVVVLAAHHFRGLPFFNACLGEHLEVVAREVRGDVEVTYFDILFLIVEDDVVWFYVAVADSSGVHV